MKSGFYVDTFIGTATTDFKTDNDLGFGVKLGNVWYFGSNETWRPGVKTVWFRGSAYFGDTGPQFKVLLLMWGLQMYLNLQIILV